MPRTCATLLDQVSLCEPVNPLAAAAVMRGVGAPAAVDNPSVCGRQGAQRMRVVRHRRSGTSRADRREGGARPGIG